MNRIVFAAAIVLGVMTPLAAASAHDDYDYNSGEHRRHARYHDRLTDAHEQAHDEGFESRREHRAYHRALRHLHRDYHDDRPRHWWRYW